MIHLVDAALRSLLVSEVSPDVATIELDAPTREWAARQSGPAVNVFLYDVREEIARRDVSRTPIRENGRVIARPLPPLWVRLAYLLTAWTSKPEEEHQLLSQLLSCVLSHDVLPADHLPPELARFELAIVMHAAMPPTQDRSISDIWSAVGGEMRPSIDLQIVAPLQPGDDYHLETLVEHPLQLRLHQWTEDQSAQPTEAVVAAAPG